MTDDPRPEPASVARADLAADRLALALEDVGFDVGVAFPALRGGVDRHGADAVELGAVTPAVATQLSTVLARAARRGIALPRR